MAKEEENENEQQASPPIWEWILAVTGLVIVCVAIGMTLYRGVTQDSSPPNLKVIVKAVSQKDQGFLVEFDLINSANRTASTINVEGRLKMNGEAVETRTMTMAYAPSNSTRSGGLIFSRDPRLYEVEIGAVGFENP